MSDKHYLERELYERIQFDDAIFEFLQSGSLDGLWYWDIENPEHEWLSPRFWQVLGYDSDTKKHLASEWQDLIHPDDLAVALDNFHKHVADPDHPYDQYVRYRHQDGSTVWVRCRGLAVRDENGKATRMLGAHTDVTGLKRAEKKVRRLVTELRVANQMLEEFSYSVSHDLRAPLRAIDGFARAFEEDYGDQVDDEGRRLLGVIRRNTTKMGRLIDDLLAFSRLIKKDLARSRLDMRGLVEEVWEELVAQVPDRVLRTHIGDLPEAKGDPALLRQVWLNLLGNAIKYTRGRDPAEIDVTGAVSNGEVQYSVKDNGVGFDMAYADKLFGVFQRLHKESEFEGTGVGLALAKRIIARHGGRVWAEACVDEGATFSFALPDRRG